MPSTGRRRGLRKLSPDFIGKAADETAQQVTRIGLTFLGTTVFCLLSLLSPDSALLGGSERISVPLAGPVSFFGFMLLGPAVLIMLRVYLQIYVEHSERWDRLARSMSIARAPTLGPLQNPLIRLFNGLCFYLLLPLTMLLFAWKAAVFPAWGSGLLGVAAAVVGAHLMLPLRKLSWSLKTFLSACAAIVVFANVGGYGLAHRPFNLFRANLSGQWLAREDLRGANLSYANLRGAHLAFAKLRGAVLNYANLNDAFLIGADLTGDLTGDSKMLATTFTGANLNYANLKNAFLTGTDLTGAELVEANLTGATLIWRANLSRANLSRADLSGAKLFDTDLTGAFLGDAQGHTKLNGANLSDVRNLTQEQLDKACGNANTKLPEGLTLKAMCER
ncbi:MULTISPECIES: pentapeptide repeat-containing protein [unclassified Bradyrhizobium]